MYQVDLMLEYIQFNCHGFIFWRVDNEAEKMTR